MPQSTDLNVAPFNDDFDPTNQYYRILFRPSVPVQARELTQLQSILQNQIEEFGLNVLEQGTVVRGCTFTFVGNYPFVKIRDLQVDGQPVNISAFANGWATEISTGLTAKILNFQSGLESQNPNLNTLFVKYTNAGNTGTTVFANNSVLNIFSPLYSVQSLTISSNGSGYHNTDVLQFVSATGTGATGQIQTNANGAITSAILTAAGNNFLTTPTVLIANSTGGSSNGVGGLITANISIAQVTVSPNTIVTPGNTETYPTGFGFGFRITDGVIFQKGFFAYVEPQEIIVKPYGTDPSNVVVGFSTLESIVNNSVDTSLNDNAQGISNEGAPGAYRLKLEPTLVLNTVANSATANDFFMLVEFQNGVPVRQRQDTSYGKLNNEFAKRTFEESGNYVVRQFKILPESLPGNTTHFVSWISSGLGYVNGYRVEQFGRIPLEIRKGTDVQEKTNLTITASYGSFTLIKEFVGNFPFNTGSSVSLRDTAATQISDRVFAPGSAPGNEIGTAKLRSVVFNSGQPGSRDCQYRAYLFDIKMNTGQNFASVRSLFFDSSTDGVADVVLDTFGNATLNETDRGALLFPFGKRAIKSLRNLANTNDTTFIYRTHNTGASFGTNGLLTLSLVGSEQFPYTPSANLSASEREELVVMTTASANGTTLTGTISLSNVANTVIGVGTSFLSQLNVGDYILANTEVHRITVIANNTYAQTESNAAAVSGGVTFQRHYPAFRAIPLTHTILSRHANVDSNANNLTIDLGETISNSMTVLVGHNVSRNPAVQLTKTLLPDHITKVNITSTAMAARNQWSLGVPDILTLKSVTSTTNTDYITNAANVTQHFEIVSNQKDSHYGLSFLRKKASSAYTVANNDHIVVTYDVLRSSNTGGGAGFYSIDSYPVDDASSVLPTDKIRTQQVPIFGSTGEGFVYDLRDSVDFRPQAQNTAAYSNTLGGATENPSNTETFDSTEKFFPSPNKQFTTDLQFYLGRIDKIVINSLGQLIDVEGAASEQPFPPREQTSGMTLASMIVPPFPTLDPITAASSGRTDYGVRSNYEQIERLTMKDLNSLNERITALEYYTSLSLLEKNTSDMVIPSEVDPTLNRFKNGIFVDPFNDLSLAGIGNPEYSAAIDPVQNELIPKFDQFAIDLEENTDTNITKVGDMFILDYVSTELMSQPYATRVRNCTEDYWAFDGKAELIPSYDNFYEIRTNPIPVATSNTVPVPTANVHSTIPINIPAVSGFYGGFGTIGNFNLV